jgi:peptidyl-prolyl cis-trans isomerase D
MISIFRDFTKSWIFTLLMALLILSFAVFGLRDVFSPVGGNNVITAGRRVMTDDEFKDWFSKFREQYPNQHNGETISAEDFVARGWYIEALNEQANQLALTAWFESQHIQPSTKLLVEQIAKYPNFQNTATGVFDKMVYKQALARAGYTETRFERDTVDQIAAAQYSQAAFAGVHTPRVFAATQAAFALQTRDISYVVVTPNSVPAPGKPTDADIQKFYQDNIDRLTIPELRQASLIVFNTSSFSNDAKVDDATLQKAYQRELETLKTPETRSFVEIIAPDMNAAAAISAAVKAGQMPDAAAKAHGGKVLPFTAVAKANVPDQKIADAVFSLGSGEVSAPIQGDLGIAVVKIGEIKAGETPSFESQRAKLIEQVTKDKALDKLNQVTHAFADAMAAGENFDATASKLGLKIIQLPAFTAQGQAVDAKTGQPMVNPKTGQPVNYAAYPGFAAVLKDIFNLQPGTASDVESLGEGQYFAVKLNTVKASGPVPLDDALRARLAGAWQAQKVSLAVEAKADDIMARLKQGESFEKIAAEVKSPLDKKPGVNRQVAMQNFGGAGARMFAVKAGETFQAQVNEVAFVVGRIDAIHQGTPEAANQLAPSIAPQLTNSFKQDIATITPKAARQAVKTKTYPDTALRALGVTPPDTKGAKSGKKKS